MRISIMLFLSVVISKKTEGESNFMVDLNFMLVDITSTILGFVLFPLVLVIPGYVFSWFLDLFSFRQRILYSRLAISLLVSFAVSPILFYLLSSLFGFHGTFVFVCSLILTFVSLLLWDKPIFLVPQSPAYKWVFICVGLWIVFALFSLVDIQIGNELYYSVAGFDHATRISIVDAMARTGVPPVNPSYYPGEPVKLSFLYFYWYILGAFVDYIGGSFVDARGAFFASVIWCGLGLMSAISFYLHLRVDKRRTDIWKHILTGFVLLIVTGLDIFPAILMMSNIQVPMSDMEHWNEQITAWMSSLLWVPHHVAALVVGVVIVLLGLSISGQVKKRQLIHMTVAGAAFASAFGLSVWVTFVLVLFWSVWILQKLFISSGRQTIIPMMFAGVVALLLSAGFLSGILSGIDSVSSTDSFPVVFEPRNFIFVEIVTAEASRFVQYFLRLLFLPLNYFLELGFYFLVAFIWLRHKRMMEHNREFALVEILLLASSFFIGTFLRSTLIENNDLGWRSWLLGQFILLIWGVDILLLFKTTLPQRTQVNLIFLLAFGALSTLLNVGLLRFEPLLAGGKLGDRIFSARQAYTTILRTLPENIIVQYNPSVYVNRPAGLYSMRQSAISGRTAYGIPPNVYLERVSMVSEIFQLQNLNGWQPVDNLCNQYFIDVLVIENTDPLWYTISILKNTREAYYLDDYFAVFSCGYFVSSSP